ncbi:MAG: hypothetical protein CR979_03965, partial [Propionibacterium sp.]
VPIKPVFPAQGFRPPQPQTNKLTAQKKNSKGWIYLLFVIAVIGIIIFDIFAADNKTNSDPVSSVSPIANPTFPSNKQPPAPEWLPKATWDDLDNESGFPPELTDLPIYHANFPVANCPKPTIFVSNDQFVNYFEKLEKCLRDAWQPYFEAMGTDLPPAEVQYYEDEVTSPCGAHDSSFPAFYCSANNKIYVSEDLYRYAQKYPTYAPETAIHEHFHHVQWRLGIFRQAYKQGIDKMEISRRVELQTICSSSRLMLNTNIGFTAEDYEKTLENLNYKGEKFHGSTKSQTYWGTRGFYMNTLQGCNTWLVSPEKVE